MEQKSKIWVVCAEGNNKIQEHTFQLLGKARALGLEKSTAVAAICIGTHSSENIELLNRYGAQEILSAMPCGNSYEEVVDILTEMVRVYSPNLVLFPATPYGRVIAAMLQGEVGAGLTAECIDVSINENDQYVFSRTALNSSVIANIVCMNTTIQMCTVRKNVFSNFVKEYMEQGQVTEYTSSTVTKRNKNVEKLTSELCEVISSGKLETASIVFAFGRGIQNEKVLKLLYQVADYFGAEIACTRPMVEDGWLDRSRQVGQSGISVSPNLYFAFGISGASQHIVGIKNAKCVIAVNRDAKAPIFEFANYSIVDDCEAVLTGLVEWINKKEAQDITE